MEDVTIATSSGVGKHLEKIAEGTSVSYLVFNKQKITELLQLPYEPLLILAIGKGNELIRLTPISEDESKAYYRKNGIHFVPKIKLNDLIF